METELTKVLRQLMANTFFMYYKAHAIHWNMTGIEFPQYHDWFSDAYEGLFGSVDAYAEYIRAMGAKAPSKIADLATMVAGENLNDTDSLMSMIAKFDADNNKMIQMLKAAGPVAANASEWAIENFFAERLDHHQKMGWQLRAIMGS